MTSYNWDLYANCRAPASRSDLKSASYHCQQRAPNTICLECWQRSWTCNLSCCSLCHHCAHLTSKDHTYTNRKSRRFPQGSKLRNPYHSRTKRYTSLAECGQQTSSKAKLPACKNCKHEYPSSSQRRRKGRHRARNGSHCTLWYSMSLSCPNDQTKYWKLQVCPRKQLVHACLRGVKPQQGILLGSRPRILSV